MKIILSPIESTTADNPPSVSGDVLTYRGDQYDLGLLPDGGEVEADMPFIGSIKRVNGQVELTLQYQYSTENAEANQPTDLAAYTFIVENGQCPDPIVYKPASEPVEVPHD